MSNKLQQAIQATRAGDQRNAQFLLTQAIQENPENPQSWYLLSLLVDDKEKKQTYLTKVLDLDPDHSKAHQHFAALMETAVPQPLPALEEEYTLPKTAPVTLSSDSPDLETQDAGKTLPDWMADDLPDMLDEAEEAVAATAVISTAEDPLPEWLAGSIDEDWEQEETAVDDAISEKAAGKEDAQPKEKTPEDKKEVAAKEKKPAKSKKSSETNLNYMLIGLVIIAVIVFLILAYMISPML